MMMQRQVMNKDDVNMEAKKISERKEVKEQEMENKERKIKVRRKMNEK